jgi:hypothetical protein
MQCCALSAAQVSGQCPAQRPHGVDRDCPLQTDGDRCLWHVGGTTGENKRCFAPGGDDFRLGRRVRTVLGNEHLVGKSPEGSRRLGDETQT